MRGKIISVLIDILTELLYLFFAGLVLGIVGISYFFIFMLGDDVIEEFGNYALVLIFLMVYIGMIALPIILRKRMKSDWRKPLSLILSVILAVVINGIIYNSAYGYISNFSRHKWDNYEELRIYMIEDLEERHQIIGRNEQEIIEMLGECTTISEYNGKYRFEYYIGDDLIDPYTYDVIFENGIVVDTAVIQH